MKKTALVMVLSGTFVSSLASAGGMAVTSPGLRCVETGDASPEIVYSSGASYNSDTATNTFQCPIQRSWMGIDGAEYEYFENVGWRATVDDRSSTGNISCFARSCLMDGTSCITSLTYASSGTGVQSLGSASTATQLGTYGRSAYLQCSIPAAASSSSSSRSGILAYTTLEVTQ